MKLMRKLVSIASHLDKQAGNDVIEVTRYIEELLRNLGYPQVERQPVEGQRRGPRPSI